MNIELCDVSCADDLAALFVEMESHYFGEGAVTHEQMETYLRERVFSAFSGVKVIAAREQGAMLGFAAFSLMYPGPLASGQAFMKELFVAKNARGKGIARELIRFIAKICLAHGCTRFDWTTDRTNQHAGELYRSIGAQIVDDIDYYRLSDAALIEFAQGH